MPMQILREIPHGGRVKQIPHRHFPAQRQLQPRAHPRGDQRIPTQGEEIVIEPDPAQAQHFGENLGDDFFGLGLRRPEGCGGKHRCRQRFTVDLARRGQRELVEHHDLRRHHVIGQPRAQPLTHHGGIGLRRAADVTDEVVAGDAVVHGDGGLGDLRAGQQGVFDFTQLDALAAQFDLGVGPAHVGQGASGVQRTRSPVRYIRSPALPWGLATNRSAVKSTRPT